MKITIVNNKDEIISFKERNETTISDIRRIVGLNVLNEDKEILIAKRVKTKKIDPNLWGPSVAGTVDKGYSYYSTIIKEANEEIGLLNIKPIFLKKYYYETDTTKRFVSFYYIVIKKDTKLKIQQEEVSEIKWISSIELEEWFNKKPQDFIPSFKNTLNNIKETIKLLEK